MINEDKRKIAQAYDDYHKDPRNKERLRDIKALDNLAEDLEEILDCAAELWKVGDIKPNEKLVVNHRKLNIIANDGLEAYKEIIKKKLNFYFTDREASDLETVVSYIKNRWNASLYRKYGDWFSEEFQNMDADYESSLDSLEAMVNDISAFKRMSEIYVDNINNKY